MPYRFANVHVATVLDGNLALLVLLLLLFRRPARQRRDALVDHDALLDPGPASQQPHFPGQHQDNGAQAGDEHTQDDEYALHDPVQLARRHVRTTVQHGHFGITVRQVCVVFVAPDG